MSDYSGLSRSCCELVEKHVRLLNPDRYWLVVCVRGSAARYWDQNYCRVVNKGKGKEKFGDMLVKSSTGHPSCRIVELPFIIMPRSCLSHLSAEIVQFVNPNNRG